MRNVSLVQILSPFQLKQVERILKTAPPNDRIQRLKDYYSTFREDLERQGILAEYLAYATEHAHVMSHEQRKTQAGH